MRWCWARSQNTDFTFALSLKLTLNYILSYSGRLRLTCLLQSLLFFHLHLLSTSSFSFSCTTSDVKKQVKSLSSEHIIISHFFKVCGCFILHLFFSPSTPSFFPLSTSYSAHIVRRHELAVGHLSVLSIQL